jgi:hypothetical protein
MRSIAIACAVVCLIGCNDHKAPSSSQPSDQPENGHGDQVSDVEWTLTKPVTIKPAGAARQLWFVGDANRREIYVHLAVGPDVVIEKWRIDGGERRVTLRFKDRHFNPLAISPDGKRVVGKSYNGKEVTMTTRTFPLSDDKEKTLMPCPREAIVGMPNWCADSSKVVVWQKEFSSGHAIVRMFTESNAEVVWFKKGVSGYGCNATGQTVFAATGKGITRFVVGGKSAPKSIIDLDDPWIWDVFVSLDARRVAIQDVFGKVTTLNGVDGTIISEWQGTPVKRKTGSLGRFVGRSRTLCVTDGRSFIELYDSDDGELQDAVYPETQGDDPVAVSVDGRAVAWTTAQGVKVWKVIEKRVPQ